MKAIPVYNYHCRGCGSTKEDVILAVAQLDIVVVPCEVCQSPMVRTIGNAGGFRLKGGGWAEDYYSDYIGDINPRRVKDGKNPLDHNSIHGTDYED